MKGLIRNKKGAISIEMIIAIIIAVVVLLVVVSYFIRTFGRSTAPVDTTLKAIECEGYCQAKNQASYNDNKCSEALAKVGKEPCKFAA